jgi:hypothetical protein
MGILVSSPETQKYLTLRRVEGFVKNCKQLDLSCISSGVCSLPVTKRLGRGMYPRYDEQIEICVRSIFCQDSCNRDLSLVGY